MGCKSDDGCLTLMTIPAMLTICATRVTIDSAI